MHISCLRDKGVHLFSHGHLMAVKEPQAKSCGEINPVLTKCHIAVISSRPLHFMDRPTSKDKDSIIDNSFGQDTLKWFVFWH
jgi:hypothetical protein